ncbi:MAG TPA: hypothetical protein VFA10_17895 [Ktedonobacteraceae bacterium]|nr:hypothetical protein [Ktedonobacteraceae bacterium]
MSNPLTEWEREMQRLELLRQEMMCSTLQEHEIEVDGDVVHFAHVAEWLLAHAVEWDMPMYTGKGNVFKMRYLSEQSIPEHLLRDS